jgi:hypothetical protein
MEQRWPERSSGLPGVGQGACGIGEVAEAEAAEAGGEVAERMDSAAATIAISSAAVSPGWA